MRRCPRWRRVRALHHACWWAARIGPANCREIADCGRSARPRGRSGARARRERLKGVKGSGASPVPGSFPSGRRAELNLQDGSVYSPPIMRKSGDGTALSIEGTPAQAEKAYNTWRDCNPHINAPEFKDLPLQHQSPPSPTTRSTASSPTLLATPRSWRSSPPCGHMSWHTGLVSPQVTLPRLCEQCGQHPRTRSGQWVTPPT
jgi:hypothetical protein